LRTRLGDGEESPEHIVRDSKRIARRYAESCQEGFWQSIFRFEVEYLNEQLRGCTDVLSVGCGPAIIESELSRRGFNVTGLDVSLEALGEAPDNVRTVAARAEDLSFPDRSFDAVIFVASLQFAEDFRKAVENAALVLRPNGRVVVMLLNPQSDFFKRRSRDRRSYLRRIRHTDLRRIEVMMAEKFDLRTEYFLGVKGDKVFDSADATESALFNIVGTKRGV
jgi:SAM-dependent methyltransferase